MLNGRHQRYSVKPLRIKDDEEWAVGPLQMRNAFQVYLKPIPLAQEIKQSKIASICNVNVRRKEPSKILWRVQWATREDLRKTTVHLNDVGIVNILEGKTCSMFWAANPKWTSKRYNKVGKPIVKHQRMLPVLFRLGNDAVVGNTLDTTAHNDPRHYISPQIDVFVLIQATDALVENNHNAAYLLASSIRRQARTISHELGVWYFKKDDEQFPIFVLFLNIKPQYAKIKFQSINSLRTSSTRPFHYYACDNTTRWKAHAEIHERRIWWRFERHFSSREKVSSNVDVRDKNSLKDTFQKRNIQKKTEALRDRWKLSVLTIWKYLLRQNIEPGRRNRPRPVRSQ